ncbi:hypothetical protein TNCT_310901 [Trichonephila clavata]|uniref:Uncharacterized protein n=1 Tax=Trichonephila clavata TaxID=2740835 RepID=A0A8X6FSY4_TRICU|nr:hypothetical protein TNCT_310901 [Trichonephila clavata]
MAVNSCPSVVGVLQKSFIGTDMHQVRFRIQGAFLFQSKWPSNRDVWYLFTNPRVSSVRAWNSFLVVVPKAGLDVWNRNLCQAVSLFLERPLQNSVRSSNTS